MDYSSLIKIIPDLFMYVIPGYIALHIRKIYRQERSHKEKHTILISIVYSFLIDKILFVILNFIEWIYEFILKCNSTICNQLNISDEWNIVLKLVLSFLFGFVITIYPDTRFSKKIANLFHSNTEPYSTVWNYALNSPKGAWARIFLHDENICYTGTLLKYTCDPDQELREIYLGKFTSFRIIDNQIIENNSENDNAYVLINTKDIKRIEIFKD